MTAPTAIAAVDADPRNYVRLATAPGLKVPVYRTGWRARPLGRDRETGLAVWLVADLDVVDVVLVLGGTDVGLQDLLAQAGYTGCGAGAGHDVWARRKIAFDPVAKIDDVTGDDNQLLRRNGIG